MVVTERSTNMPLVISSKRLPQKTAPECLTRLQSLEVDKGITVQLSVIIAGNPTPKITWTLDDEIIPENSDRFKFERDDTENKYSLIITHITRQQEGVYRCVAKNCEGSCSTMGFITVKEVIRRRRRKISRKPNIATISEWKSQEENELDSEQDTFINRNRHCWDWWNMDALSDSDDVFEKPERNDIRPSKKALSKVKPPLKRGKSKEEPSPTTPQLITRRPFTRARSAEPETNLSRQKSKSLPDIGLNPNTAANKYKKLLNFWEQITSKKK